MNKYDFKKVTELQITFSQAIVNKHVSDQKGKTLYTCFVDFQKAFDSVWDDGQSVQLHLITKQQFF